MDFPRNQNNQIYLYIVPDLQFALAALLLPPSDTSPLRERIAGLFGCRAGAFFALPTDDTLNPIYI